MFGAALEDSADQKRERIFVASGLAARELVWNDVEDQWWARLSQDNVAYFRSSDCKRLDGPFRHLRSQKNGREIANLLRDELETYLVSANVSGFALGVVMADYREVLQKVPAAQIFYEDDPTVMAFYHLMYEINRTIRRKAKGCSVAFIYDKSSASEKVAHAFNALKTAHPVSGRSMATFAPLDDRDHAPLQAADMLGDVCRGIFESWLNQGRPRCVPIPERWQSNLVFTGKFDKEYLIYTVQTNLANPRFRKGLLPVRKMGSKERRRRDNLHR